MFEGWLCPAQGGRTEGEVLWAEGMQGVRICRFDCTARRPIPMDLAPGHFETLFVLHGSVSLELASGRCVRVGRREILLLSDVSRLRSIWGLGRRLSGILVAVDSGQARDSLAQLCTLLGGLVLDVGQVQARMKAHEGCARVGSCVWSEAVFSTLETLPPADRGHYCTLKAVELLYLLCGPGAPLPQSPSAGYFDDHQLAAVRQAHAYMREHPGEHLTIPQLAQRFHLSSTLFKTCFRHLYGKPVHRWLLEYRLDRAAALLAETDLAVGRIAQQVGYNSPSQFGVAFKRLYKLSPTRYRQDRRKKNV